MYFRKTLKELETGRPKKKRILEERKNVAGRDRDLVDLKILKKLKDRND